MKYIEAKVTFDHSEPSLAADLVAGVFFEFDLQGVVIEDPGLEPPADDWAEDAVARPARHSVAGYLPLDDRLEGRRARLEQALAQTADRIGMVWRAAYREMDEQDWAESWKAFFWPQRIGRHIVVKPSWRGFAPEPGDIVLDLDPGMAFGTGTHPTTSLCIELIEEHLAPGDSFLDIGTGSGILMLAAAKLGAARVCGGDRDELAVRIAADNLRRNAIPPERVCLATGALTQAFRGRFDVVAANILTQVVLELVEDVPRVLTDGGLFLCSGIIEENRSLVLARLMSSGFEMVDVRDREGWVAIAARRSALQPSPAGPVAPP
jgi:ribosomal protein L11 methyltransferase